MSGPDARQSPTLAVDWCRDPARASEVADFFLEHAEPSYISHSELQFGRAASPDLWADGLHGLIREQAVRAASPPATPGPPAGLRLALAREGEVLAGMAFISFALDAPAPFATLEDLLVGPGSRSRGVGRAIVDWATQTCRDLGARRLFLESGAANHRAHSFFEGRGFTRTSIVMMRDL